VGLSSFSSSLRQAQTTGTLEAMLTTPTALSTIILSSSLWSYLLTTLRVLIYLLIGGAFLKVDLGGGNYPGALIVLILTIVSFSSLGILAASFIMVLKRGDPITWLFNATSSFLGGIYYPVTILPGWLQFFSYLLPVTYALRGMRLALLQGASTGAILPDILVLAIFSVLLMPASLLAFRFAVKRAKVDGSLSQY
jgi:ABC-2 type transport system permease protein